MWGFEQHSFTQLCINTGRKTRQQSCYGVNFGSVWKITVRKMSPWGYGWIIIARIDLCWHGPHFALPRRVISCEESVPAHLGDPPDSVSRKASVTWPLMQNPACAESFSPLHCNPELPLRSNVEEEESEEEKERSRSSENALESSDQAGERREDAGALTGTLLSN